nr:hypothetical protein GCM10020093_090030 [Planobispora longispora]
MSDHESPDLRAMATRVPVATAEVSGASRRATRLLSTLAAANTTTAPASVAPVVSRVAPPAVPVIPPPAAAIPLENAGRAVPAR